MNLNFFICFIFLILGVNAQNTVKCDKLKSDAIIHAEKREFNLVIKKLSLVIDMKCSKPYHSYYNRGVSYQNLNLNNQAIKDFTTVINSSQDYLFESYYNRGTIFLELKNFENAIVDFSRALKLNAKSSESFYNRGLAYFKIGKYKMSMIDFDNAIKINPNYSKAIYNLATVKYKLGINYCNDYKKACDLGNKKACQYYNLDCLIY